MNQVRVVEYLSFEHKQTISLRNRLLREPIGLVYSDQDLEDEKHSVHVAYFADNGDVIGACFYLPYADDTIKLRQMAVDSTIQKQGVGRKLIAFVQEEAQSAGYNKIYLHARKEALGFYKKLGFKVIGEEFIEVGIPHYEMLKEF